jgi:hypothetical protein
MSRDRITSEDALMINQIVSGMQSGDDVRDMLDQINDMSPSKRDRVLKSIGSELGKRDVDRRQQKLGAEIPGEDFYVEMPTKGPMREFQALQRTQATRLQRNPETGEVEVIGPGTLMVEPRQQTGMFPQPGTRMSEIDGAIAELKRTGRYLPVYDEEPMMLARAINDMYKGPEVPYEQQVGQAVRSAGYPPAKMFGTTTDEMASLNETARRGAQQMRGVDYQALDPASELQSLGFSQPSVRNQAQQRDLAVRQNRQQMREPMDRTQRRPTQEELSKIGFILDTMNLERQIPVRNQAQRRDLEVSRQKDFMDRTQARMDSIQDGFQVGYQPTQKTSESGPQSVTLAELRGNPAYDVGFRRFLQEREQYKSSQRPSISEEEEFFKGGSMYAESARDRAIRDRDNASIEALGFAEGQEFAERETQRSVDRALRGGLRMEPTREDVAFMESVSRPEDIEFKQRPEDIVVEQDIPPEML